MSGESIVPPDLLDSQKSPKRILAWLTSGLTLLQALFAFVLSFSALTDLTTAHQFSIPPLFPLVVEAGVVIFSLNALYRFIHGESTRWQWCLIIGSSVLAGMFNAIGFERFWINIVRSEQFSVRSNENPTHTRFSF